MTEQSTYSRRAFLQRSGTAGLGLAAISSLNLLPDMLRAAEASDQGLDWVRKIADKEVRAGVEAAIFKNLLPAATEQYYPGFFNICADGRAIGSGATWPGLDSWQMAGTYLLLGRTRLVLDYFDYVRASQRKDGNIPFAIFPGDTKSNTWLRGLKPEDKFTYQPPEREGLPASSQETKTWIGLFEHWQLKANPLSNLGAVCYLLTAAEIFDHTRSFSWLKERLPSLEAAANYLLGRRTGNGLMSGSGFYIELPPRHGWDGVTQCYVIHAFRELARLFEAVGQKASRAKWSGSADEIEKSFLSAFWREDHLAEYIHIERGLVDSHGLSDVNWAAVAFGIVAGRKRKRVWARLMKEPGFWVADIPTQLVTKPFTYEPWEDTEPLPFKVESWRDAAAMGRAWYLEAKACQRMKANKRLIESTRKVCRAAVDGFWRERYLPQRDGSVKPVGAQKYCEWAAVLLRVVIYNQELFCRK